MKIKHWQGYGCVEAKKLSQTVSHGTKTVVIRVTGDHEWGLKRDDKYDVVRWLCSKLAKDCTDDRQITDMQVNSRYEKGDNGYTEVCDYAISYDLPD